MKHSIESLEEYLRETLQTPIHLERWRGGTRLPAYLRGEYRFFEGTISGVRILLVTSDGEPVPSAAKKHEEALRQEWDGPVAFVFDRITPRSRQRMIREGLAFVVPGSQIYLPVLGADLRERYRTRIERADRLRPSAQVLFLKLLTEHSRTANTPSDSARQLGYTQAAMGQALDQLEHAELVRVRKAGRERLFDLAGTPVDLWRRAQPLLATPVKRTRYAAGAVTLTNRRQASGLSALANYTLLGEPQVPVIALTGPQAKSLFDAEGVEELPTAEEANLEVEVWAYSPRLLSDSPAVDRLSLYLCLRDEQDERVQSALGEMMRGVTWSEA